MNRGVFVLILFFGFSACGTGSEFGHGEEIIVKGKTLELRFPRVQKVQHGEHFKIDDQVFYHNKYKDTRFIDGASAFDIQNPDFQKIDLFCSVNIPYKAPNKEFPENISSNQIAVDLAYRLLQLRDEEGQRIYRIDEGPVLNFEGRIILSRRDGHEISVQKSKETALIALKVK